ncbi:VOC family protein [Chitinophaga varians]|uniref:VOC family protein n=1 Tax=Chitinophaga varians TaxID=2202339 RepID=UPI00165EF87E|nr:VOC family protein [Chitinophaga varians]MBC9909767.1 VOC family protein [Chitinophaga varians]
MIQISAYLTFDGNCREAMGFYRECLGGQLTFRTVGETDPVEALPEPVRNAVIQATLVSGDLVLTGSDMVGEEGLIKGNTVSLLLHCNTEEETRACYRKLAVGGVASYPLQDTVAGGLFGVLTDKYGHHWLLSCNDIYPKT